MTERDITCEECGHTFAAERVRVMADWFQLPTMWVRARLRHLGCYALGVRHLATGEPGPVQELRRLYQTAREQITTEP